MSKIKKIIIIRIFLILLFMCALPSFVLADEDDLINESTEPTVEATETENPITEAINALENDLRALGDEEEPEDEGKASIKIIENLLSGASNGTFTFKISEVNGSDINNNISITTTTITSGSTSVSSGSFLVNNLKPNKDYLIEITIEPASHKFVSLESGSKVIVNSKSIIVTTKEADSVTNVISTHTFGSGGIANNKSLASNGDGTHKLALSVTGSASTTSHSTRANILIVYDVSTSMVNNNSHVTIYDETTENSNNTLALVNGTYRSLTRCWYYIDSNGNKQIYTGSYKYSVTEDNHSSSNPDKYGFHSNGFNRVYWRNNQNRYMTREYSGGTVYSGTLYRRSSATSSDDYASETEYYAAVSNRQVRLYSGFYYTVSSGWTSTNIIYEGKRYKSKTVTRGDITEKVVYDFATKLYAYNEGTGNANNVQMALITFSSRDHDDNGRTASAGDKDNAAWLDQNWTNQSSTFLSHLSSTGDNESRKLTYNGGTNWEAAMQKALDVLKTADGDPTYVIFVTDGAPTYHIGGGDGSEITYDSADHINVEDEVRNIYNFSTVNKNYDDPSKRNTDIFGIYAYGNTSQNRNYLDDVIYYAHTGTPRDPRAGTTIATPGYYTATDPEDLNNAIDDIFDKIVNTAGFGNVSISDGTTDQIKVTTSSGSIDSLLEVEQDNTKYEYYLSMKVIKDGDIYTFTRKNTETGDDEVITFRVVGDKVEATWPGHDTPVELDGTITGDDTGVYTLKYKWVANDLYDISPPAASFNPETGAVDWVLGTVVGTLLNGVTYTVEFDVWPSQYTEDLLTDLRNSPSDYNNLPDYIKDYIVDNGDGTFSLRTNTTALVTYTDSRDESGPRTTTFDNPQPVPTVQEIVSVKKDWSNTLDPEDDRYNPDKIEQIKIYLTRDGQIVPSPLVISKSNDWLREIYLSLGNIVTYTDTQGNLVAVIRHVGHDYGFAEYDYHWDLSPKIEVHPMLIDGVATMLEKTNEVSASAIGANNVIVRNDVRYYKICSSETTCNVYKESTIGTSTIDILNTRRSNVNITKEVIGDYDGDDLFDFEVTVTSPEEVWFSISKPNPDPEGKPIVIVGDEAEALISGDVNVEYLYKYDENNNYVVDDEGNPIKEATGYFSIKSGKTLTISLREGWNIRFTNVPINSTFTVKELNVNASGSITNVANMVFEDINLNITENSNITKTGTQLSGTVGLSSKIYEILCRNRYLKTIVDVVKEWIDETKQADIPDGVTVTLSSKVGENGTSTQVGEAVTLNDGNDWTKTWTDLNKYVKNDQGEYVEVFYEVNETGIIIGNTVITPNGNIFNVKNSVNAIIGTWTKNITSTANDTGTSYEITNTWAEKPKTGFTLKKVSFNTKEELNGAVFYLYRFTGEPDEEVPTTLLNPNDPASLTGWAKIGEFTSNPNVIFSDLYAGTYRLVEIIAPNGYILPQGQWNVAITEANDSLVVTYTGINNPPAIDETNLIYNEEIPEMPSTGGMGIYELSILGLILMALASFILIYSQREQI